MFLDMTLGIIGAILDGDDDRSWRYRVSGFNLYSLLVAIGGSALLLVSLLFCMPFILHAVRGFLHLLRRSPRPPSRFSELRTRKLRSSSIRLLVLNLVRRTLRWM